MRDRPGGKAEIGFRLTAAGGKEQQVDDLAVFVRPVLQPSEVEQNERELERSPFWLALGERIAAPTGLALAGRAGDRFVHRLERETRERVGAQQRDAARNAVAREP